MKNINDLVKAKEDMALELFDSDGGFDDLVLLNIIFEAYIKLVEVIDTLIENMQVLYSHPQGYPKFPTST